MKATIKMGEREYRGEFFVWVDLSDNTIAWRFIGELSPFGSLSRFSFKTKAKALADAESHGITILETV